jgi:hypothetical protein
MIINESCPKLTAQHGKSVEDGYMKEQDRAWGNQQDIKKSFFEKCAQRLGGQFQQFHPY